MGKIAANTKDRVGSAVRWVERNGRDESSEAMARGVNQPLRWVVLTTAPTRALTPDPPTPDYPPPRTASGHPVDWIGAADSNAGRYAVDTATTVIVIFGNGYEAPAAAGAWVLCRPLGAADGIVYWECLTQSRQAQLICGTLGGALTATTASQTISNPVSMDGGALPEGTITGYNVYTTKGFVGPSGGRCVAAWNVATGRYEFIDVECP